MQIIDDLTQADTLSINVSSQIDALYDKLSSSKGTVVYGSAFWGKSTIIDGVLKKWDVENEQSHQNSVELHILRFDECLFASDVIEVWNKFLQKCIADCDQGIKSDLEMKFPTIFKNAEAEISDSTQTQSITLDDLAKCTIRFFKKAVIKRPVVFSGIHALVALKQDWPTILSAIMEVIEAKHSPNILLESQHEQLVQKQFRANGEQVSELNIYYVSLPTTKKWHKGLAKFFKKNGMKVKDKVLLHLIEQLQNHPIYLKIAVNKLIVASSRKVKIADINKIIDQMLLEYSPISSLYGSTLSAVQTSFLCAIARQESSVYAKEQLESYQLGTSANVAKMKRTFLEREILIIREEKLQFIDPMLSLFFANKPLHSIDH
jgi:hypothetical protein